MPAIAGTGPPPALEYITPVRLVRVILNGKVSVDALLDEGAECSSVKESVWRRLKVPMNDAKKAHMAGFGGEVVSALGCLEYLEIVVDGYRTWGHVFVVKDMPYDMILGRPWQRSLRLSKEEDVTDVWITIHD
ncbi:hypothetical protein C8R42DRAFT_574675, partial [Lentinula raphanica]